MSPTPWADVLAEFRDRIAPATFNAQHPGSFSYFTPPPLPSSIAGEVLAQWMRQGVDVWHAGPIGAFVEEEVVAWLCDLVGFREPDAWGVLTSGGVMANLMALAVARDVHLPRILGLEAPPRGSSLDGVRIYASDQTHFSVARGLDVLGFPAETLQVVGSDDRFRLPAGPVAAAIAEDRTAGLTPLAISAVAGSTNTGSVDDVEALGALARAEGLWLHVDAARVPGLELADSVTVDAHKWFFQAYDIGGLVVRDGSLLERTFGAKRPEYYRGGEGPVGTAASADDHDVPGQLNFYKLGFEGTRRWRALKLWMSWKHVGTRGFGRLVADTIDLAELLARRCAESDDFEALPSEPELSVVCFRHRPAGLGEGAALDEHQDRLQAALQTDGDGWLSTTRLRGATWLRAGIVNPHTTRADIDRLLASLRRLAADLA
jgi:glutamate/tyrosine decarboxylase-like PLP-dependent enzyme